MACGLAILGYKCTATESLYKEMLDIPYQDLTNVFLNNMCEFKVLFMHHYSVYNLIQYFLFHVKTVQGQQNISGLEL